MSRRRKPAPRRAAQPVHSHWKLDWHIPVATILTWVATIGFQSAAIVWWAAGIDNRVTTLEAAYNAVPSAERVGRIEERLGGIADNVKDVKQLLQERQARRG
jgi:hypothetical protein